MEASLVSFCSAVCRNSKMKNGLVARIIIDCESYEVTKRISLAPEFRTY